MEASGRGGGPGRWPLALAAAGAAAAGAAAAAAPCGAAPGPPTRSKRARIAKLRSSISFLSLSFASSSLWTLLRISTTHHNKILASLLTRATAIADRTPAEISRHNKNRRELLASIAHQLVVMLVRPRFQSDLCLLESWMCCRPSEQKLTHCHHCLQLTDCLMHHCKRNQSLRDKQTCD